MLGALLGALTMVPTAEAAAGGLSVSDAWMRVIVPSRPAAGYFTLTNDSDTDRTLVGAAASACGKVMLHQSVHKGGQDKMVMVKSLTVPAHGKLTFAPGGYHIMCMSPAKDMKPGKQVSVTLKFADGGTLNADFPVRGATGK